jgi:EAL domain-containing protein (putative c-di-GMP-specific phosphodiesterase class I)
LEEACRQLNAWQTQLPQATALTVSVNISAQQLYQGDLPGMVQQILERTGLSARSLKLEITESIFMEDVEAAIGACTRLQDLGVCLQIDDFGTGYSSFNYLHRLPINTLKIDKSFIDLLNLGGRHVEIVRTIATLAHNLQLTVIAEGVETEAQLTYVEALGCEQVQGYLISKPLTAHAAEGFIQSALVSLAPPPLLFSPPSANHAPSPLHATVAVAH